MFGFTVLAVLLVPMYFIDVGPPFSSNPHGRLEDALDAVTQLRNNPTIIAAVTGEESD